MNDVVLEYSAAGLGEDDLDGFFLGWREPPSPARRVQILHSAHLVVLARAHDRRVVGFITAITDGTFSAYIPLLEVAPDWRGRGIGTRLVRAMLERPEGCYIVDLVCDDDLVPFYEKASYRSSDCAGCRETTIGIRCAITLP